MNPGFLFQGERLFLLPSGALWWPGAATLIFADLHLGKAERMARRGGAVLPPYEVHDTLRRMEADIALTAPRLVICLGDSLDDDAAIAGLSPSEAQRLRDLTLRIDWIWIAGNHDPAPSGLGGRSADAASIGPLTFRHIATPDASGEVSGHYHPKARLALRGRSVSRPCLLHDRDRVILPAYGTYTGGLDWTAPVLAGLFPTGGCAILTGPTPHAVPIPCTSRSRRASA
ncbi:hypothetical protein OCGS_1276 [Oceaniovalibus guishaninsula JLT2003]|uniref:Calcineurin-like phosphoesterase domain-containing protein n=1 Tax=Oceaniovalibus guishaninsula JLT2003 TaxID=1231392 RepID=K2HA82_9RHOB|nr:ligase-associated DNA damage response endonuclease PdeM [Oceaniovalibus guishaninsula]EKE44438.1 hypothetical protein OCGS_1276 [Oceaniovalibus guishaninsula JLT2003]